MLACATATAALIAPPGNTAEIAVGLRLLERGLELGKRCFGLGDLMVELRGSDFRQQLAFRDVIADIDLASRNIAGRAREDVGGSERACRAGLAHAF
jgi:hypothetical protein